MIKEGAEALGWSLEELMDKTILAMRSCEARVNEEDEGLRGLKSCGLPECYGKMRFAVRPAAVRKHSGMICSPERDICPSLANFLPEKY